jgi:hypothetical protein
MIMKSEKEIIQEMFASQKRMDDVRNGRSLDKLSMSEIFIWMENQAEHQALQWVLMS